MLLHVATIERIYVTYVIDTAISLKFSDLFQIRSCFPGKFASRFTKSCAWVLVALG
jgi:hypothetical protein